MKVYTLFEMEPIGVGGALEAVYAVAFCSEACCDAYARRHPTAGSKAFGPDTSFADGHVCDECDGPISEGV